MVKTITTENFETEVLKSDIPVVVDFWASWCGPCKMLGPVIEEISEEKNNVKFCKVNVDDEQQIAQQFGIMSIPTCIKFENGKPAAKTVGVLPKGDLIFKLGI